MQNETNTIRFWPVMLAIFFGSFLSILGISSINIALPVLMNEFSSDLGTVQWVLTGFMLSLGVVAPLTGYLGDRFGYKKVYLYAMAGFVVFSLLCALSWNMSSLIAFRIAQGAFSGLVLPATMTIIFQVMPMDKRAFAMSIWGLSATLAPAFGPTISGWLIDHYSWPWLFFFNIPIGVVAILFIQWMIPDYRVSTGKPLDKSGLAAVILSSASLLLALSEGREWGWTSGRTLGLLAAGVVLLALFIVRELKARHPLLNLRVFGNGRFSVTLVSSTIITISLYSGTLLVPLFLQNVQAVTPLDAGIIMLPASLIMALAMPLAGKLYPAIGPRWMVVGGIVLILVGSYEMTRLQPDTSYLFVILWMAVRNIGVSMAYTAASTAGMEEIPPELTGHASSVSNWVRNVGGSFAIALFTSLLISHASRHAGELAAGGRQTGAAGLAYTMSVNDVFMAATVIAAIALPFGLLAGKKRQLKAAPAAAAGAQEQTA
ncbi:MDR family MFS transporter [Paenibacillus humicola]|uniref:MDR family MFS transporter n=1 Tax=Paenibacillus humicola TaxID=3110540 RepID=UPI00237B1E60|nr:MDR family MFS transporter [Paenibacillus humicola]